MAEERMMLDSMLDDNMMYYHIKYPEKNLYFLLYTNLNDYDIWSYENHTCSTRVDAWTYEEAIQHCAEFIQHACGSQMTPKEFFECYDFPDEVQSAVENTKKVLGIEGNEKKKEHHKKADYSDR